MARPDNIERNSQRVWTPEMREKVGAAHRGKKQTAEHVAKRFAARGPAWKAEVGYDGAHRRAKQALPAVCQECGVTEPLEVALRHDAPDIRTDARGRTFSIAYPPDRAYIRLCRSHHKQYDRESYSGDNHWRRRDFVRA